ncbi:MAG: ATP-binding cassette domain-containing protein, partial [Eubacteriales bacterium]
ELAENDKLKKEIARLKKTAREKTEWADRAESTKIGFDPTKVEKSMGRRSYIGAKSKKMNKRAAAIEERTSRAVEEKSELLKNIEESESLKLHTLDYHSDTLGYLKNVSISYGEKSVCENISFEIKKGDRILLRGRNGSGKSSILKLIMGENIPHTGELYLGNGVIISYVPQDVSHLSGNLSDFAYEHEIDESLFKAILRKMDFSREQFDVPIERMSMGQKKKVLIAKSLSERAHILIWDEPLNYIDVLSRIQLEELIPAFEPTMIFVEHDADFSGKISTKNIML